MVKEIYFLGWGLVKLLGWKEGRKRKRICRRSFIAKDGEENGTKQNKIRTYAKK